jgi:DNA-binding MarR family transcriptional regulator
MLIKKLTNGRNSRWSIWMAKRAKNPVNRRAAPGSLDLAVWHPDLGTNHTPNFSADQHVGTALRETFHAFAHAVAGNLRPLELSLNMWFVLRSLWEIDGRTQVDLAAKLEVTPAAMVGIINGLETAGWVERRRSETDGRAFRVFLTPMGHKVRTNATGQALQVDAKALRGFSVAEVETLLDLMRRLRTNLSD